VIRILYGDQSAANPILFNSMFSDRAVQFSRRLNWPVNADENGYERDEYDAQNPLYVIWQLEDGSHGDSMRFLPTTGPVMVNDHFRHLTNGVTIASPLIWECTRFCIAPHAKAGLTSARPLLAAAELGTRFHLDHVVGVFDAGMIRVYSALGWRPEVLGTDGQRRDAISVGLWDFKVAPWRDCINPPRLMQMRPAFGLTIFLARLKSPEPSGMLVRKQVSPMENKGKRCSFPKIKPRRMTVSVTPC
jgi:acyl homoserine lactone synthase